MIRNSERDDPASAVEDVSTSENTEASSIQDYDSDRADHPLESSVSDAASSPPDRSTDVSPARDSNGSHRSVMLEAIPEEEEVTPSEMRPVEHTVPTTAGTESSRIRENWRAPTVMAHHAQSASAINRGNWRTPAIATGNASTESARTRENWRAPVVSSEMVQPQLSNIDNQLPAHGGQADRAISADNAQAVLPASACVFVAKYPTFLSPPFPPFHPLGSAGLRATDDADRLSKVCHRSRQMTNCSSR